MTYNVFSGKLNPAQSISLTPAKNEGMYFYSDW